MGGAFKLGSAKPNLITPQRRGVHSAESATPRALGHKVKHIKKLNIALGRRVHELAQADSAPLGLIIDTSGSMNMHQRLQRAQQLATAFLLSLTDVERQNVHMFRFSDTIRPIELADLPKLKAGGGTSLATLRQIIDTHPKHMRWLVITDGELPAEPLSAERYVIISLEASRVTSPRIIHWREDKQSIREAHALLRKLMR